MRHGGNAQLAAILVADVVGYSRPAGADEDRNFRGSGRLRSDLIVRPSTRITGASLSEPATAVMIDSVAWSMLCVVRSKRRTAWWSETRAWRRERRIEFRIGLHLGDVVEEADGDLMGDGVNIAARLEGIAEPGAICLSEDAYRQVKGRLDSRSPISARPTKNIAEPIRSIA